MLGLALVVGMSYSLIAAGSHFPSDVLGAYLFATGTALCLLAALHAYESRFVAGTGREVVRDGASRVLATPAAVLPLMAVVVVAVAVAAAATALIAGAVLTVGRQA